MQEKFENEKARLIEKGKSELADLSKAMESKIEQKVVEAQRW